MNPRVAYGQQPKSNETRIDLLLDLFDGAIDRLSKARDAVADRDIAAATPLLVRAQVLVEGIASGVRTDQGDLSHNLLRLYEFAVSAIRKGDLESIDGALKVLRTLNEGFQAIRPEAVELERNGIIPPSEEMSTVQAMA
jgi:flagellin-specific chaperone FliS